MAKDSRSTYNRLYHRRKFLTFFLFKETLQLLGIWERENHFGGREMMSKSVKEF
jgi:hypothetical protein